MGETSEVPDLQWARRQRLLTLGGTVVAVGSVLLSLLATFSYPRSADDQNPYVVVAVVGAAVLAGCCLLNLIGWQLAVRHWRRGVDLHPGAWWRLSLGAHVLSYIAVLVGMYGMLAASALAGWSSPPGVYFGLAFLMIIFGQIAAGSQRLRRSGPPGTIPAYLRQLNAKVQAQR